MKDKLIENLKEYVNFLEDRAFTCSEIHKRRKYNIFRKKIAFLESELAKEEPEGVTAEEIFSKHFNMNIGIEYSAEDYHKHIIEAMETYAKTKQIDLRKELTAYEKWVSINYGKPEYDSGIGLVDEYLKQRNNG